MNVLVLYTLPPETVTAGRDRGEFELHETAANVAAALGHARICGIPGGAPDVLEALERHAPDVVFNLCEAPLGRPALEAHIAALLEWTGVRFTGCGSETLALCRRKDWTSAILQRAGVPVPLECSASGQVRLPCIVKPAAEDGSAGIYDWSVCETPTELNHAIAQQHSEYIIQEFVPGREFVVSLWGRRDPQHCSIGETQFEGGMRVITYEAKWDVDSDAFRDTPLTYTSEIATDLREAITSVAKAAWRAVGARHYLRVDVRLDASGSPRVLDVNPNPEIGEGVGICRAVQEAGWAWTRFVRELVEWA